MSESMAYITYISIYGGQILGLFIFCIKIEYVILIALIVMAKINCSLEAVYLLLIVLVVNSPKRACAANFENVLNHSHSLDKSCCRTG